jgi:transcriptional regulator with XRE-family HTH domain
MTKSESLKKALFNALDLACLSQRGIAAKTGLTAGTLTHWRTGRRNPTHKHALDIGRTLHEHAVQLERAAHEVMRLAVEERTDETSPEINGDLGVLELFHRDGEI